LADFETGPNPFLRAIVIVLGNPYFEIVRASRDSLPSTQSSSLDLKKLETTQIPRRIRERNTWPIDCACDALFPDGGPSSTTHPSKLRGPSYTDSKGQLWQADAGFSGGTIETITTPVSGTADPLLYEDYRWNPASYSIAVPNGQYQVNLYFTEANPKSESVGARVFNVSLQGTTVFPNLDIFAGAGANASLIKSANIKCRRSKTVAAKKVDQECHSVPVFVGGEGAGGFSLGAAGSSSVGAVSGVSTLV